MKILEGPEYLMTTLMRFHYDRKQNRKTKVFTDINYELELSLPVFCDNQGKHLVFSFSSMKWLIQKGMPSQGWQKL